MSASQKQSRPELHVHHHISVGPWTILGGLACLQLVLYAALSFALVLNPQSMKAFLDAVRETPAPPTSMTYADGQNTGP
jgi:hypothetical protein